MFTDWILSCAYVPDITTVMKDDGFSDPQEGRQPFDAGFVQSAASKVQFSPMHLCLLVVCLASYVAVSENPVGKRYKRRV